MNRKRLAAKVAEVLNNNDIKKYVPAQKTTFHITDDQGGKHDFTIKKEQQGVRYMVDDIDKILEACTEVIIDLIKNGENISILGFGRLFLKKRAAHLAPHPVTGEMYHTKEHYVVKFDAYKNLKAAAAIYSINDDDNRRKADDILAGNVSYNDEDEEMTEDGRD